MKRRYVGILGILSFLVGLSGCGDSSKLKIPYFETLTMEEICGGRPEYCQPTNSVGWEPIPEPIDCYGGFEKWLGRKYTNFYKTHEFVDPAPTDKDIVDNIGRHTLEGTVDKRGRAKFQAKMKADLIRLFQSESTTLPANVKASIEAEIGQLLSQTIEARKIELEYKRVYLTQEYIDNVIYRNIAGLGSEQKVSTGISVITVKGTWSSEVLKKAFASFELSGGYKTLTADSQGEYRRAKTRVLEGEFDPLSMIFRVGYVSK